MKEIALIVSLKFRAAHISHLVASYRQMEELGYKCYCYIHPDAISFLSEDIDYITDLSQIYNINVAIFWFPALANIKAMFKIKYGYKAKIIYVYHEPVESFVSYLKVGNSIWWTTKFYCKYWISLIFVILANKIILPSQKAINLYKKNATRWINHNYSYLPLIYNDEWIDKTKLNRVYFSYIGGISYDHAFDKYIDFIYNAYKKKDLPEVKYLIATWQAIPYDKRIIEMKNAGILKTQSGRPMTNEEINSYYASSFLIWNAYHRSTQSGVLAKAFMFGTPGLVMRYNLSEFVKDGREVIAVNSNSDYNELLCAVKSVIENFFNYSKNSRINFKKNYLYIAHNSKMQQIITSL